MDSSKPRGILASLEHKAAEPPRRASLSTRSMRVPALVLSSGVLMAAMLAWWLSSGPSPVIVHEGLPPAVAFTQAPAPQPEPVADNAAAAIVDEAPHPVAPPASSPALAAVLAPAPIATVVLQGERAMAARPHAKPKPKPKPVPKQTPQHEQPRSTPRAAPDTDVALLSAIVAHAKEHDVVEPRAGDSTASLLQRCQRVGGEEGRLCHVRICSTRVTDDACRFD